MSDITRTIRRQAMTQMLAFNVRMLKGIDKNHKDRSLRYFYSTPTREMFAKLMAYARYTDRPYSVTEIAGWLTISRLAAQTMVNDCEAEGYIVSTRGKHGKRLCMGSEVIEIYAETYMQQVEDLVDELKLNVLWRAFDATTELDESDDIPT
jgi:biotin operon repressor